MEFFRTLIGPDSGYQTMAQLSARAVRVFAVGILCIHIAGRRTFSQSTPLDIIVYLIVGSNLSRVMTGKAGLAAVHGPRPGRINAEMDRYIGYWKEYATNHESYDADLAVQGEVINAAKTLAEAAHANHGGTLLQAGRDLTPPRQK